MGQIKEMGCSCNYKCVWPKYILCHFETPSDPFLAQGMFGLTVPISSPTFVVMVWFNFVTLGEVMPHQFSVPSHRYLHCYYGLKDAAVAKIRIS